MTKFREPPRAATLAAVLARALPDARPGAIAHAVGSMIVAAKAHKRWGETCCSYPLTEAQQKRGDKRCTTLARRAMDDLWNAAKPLDATDAQMHCKRIAADTLHMLPDYRGEPIAQGDFTIRLTFGGDPRGPCGMLHISDMPGDGFGLGWGIWE